MESHSTQKQNFISLTTSKRLLNDIKQIIKNPLDKHGIYYYHDESDMLKGYALIIGPKDTLYEGGAYLFEFNFPTDYPYSPPVLRYKTNNGNTRFNPNLYKNSKVCVSILNTWSGEQWSSCQNISTILLVLVSLLNNTPLLNEPGINSRHRDFDSYHKSIQFENLNYAVKKMIDPLYYPRGFKKLYEKYIDYLKNGGFDILINKIKALNKSENKEELTVSLYGMKTMIDYENLLKEFKKIKL